MDADAFRLLTRLLNVKDMRRQLTGSVKLIFQPFEEGDGGARAMLADGGEDFARFADLVPAMHFYVCSRPADGPCYPHHHPKFDIDESTLPLSAALFAAFALTWQKD